MKASSKESKASLKESKLSSPEKLENGSLLLGAIESFITSVITSSLLMWSMSLRLSGNIASSLKAAVMLRVSSDCGIDCGGIISFSLSWF